MTSPQRSRIFSPVGDYLDSKMISKIIDSFKVHAQRNAFFIQGRYYTYADLAQKVSEIRNSIQEYIPGLDPKYIGVLVHDDIESFSSCIAILLSGCGYVPLNPLNPVERNLEIIEQAQLKIILSSEKAVAEPLRSCPVTEFIFTRELITSTVSLDFPKGEDDDPAYVIFTSGSTGKPKGTPISRGNLNAFLESVWDLGWDIGPEDRFLQMSSMTFDMSVITCIIPLCVGACIYTVPEVDIKYFSAYKLMAKMNITVIGIIPSTISYLEPYFSEINLPNIRYSLIGGEALPADLANKWKHCVPNSVMVNMYGPTEITVFSHTYTMQGMECNKNYHGIVSLGKPVKNVKALIVNDSMQPVADLQQGELLLNGKQLTHGYLNSADAVSRAFIMVAGERFYRTGDIVFKDTENDYYFVGRSDQQVKIQGHRVELGEVEMHAREFLPGTTVAAIARKNEFGNHHLELYIETSHTNRTTLMEYLKEKMPYYMLPVKIHLLDKIPLNQNGKIDRQKLAEEI